MTKERWVIAVLIAALAGVLLFRNGEEPQKQVSGPKTEDTAKAPRTALPRPPPPPDGNWSRPRAPTYPSYGGSFQPPATALPEPKESFRFRPLSERDRERIDRQSQDPYAPYDRGQWQPRNPRATSPEPAYGGYSPWGPAWDSPDWGTEGYSLRPAEPSTREPDTWEGAYPPQWGVVPPERIPPSHRMLPSLELPRDRKLTAR